MNFVKKKKYYSSPQIESVELDQSISLVMMSGAEPDAAPGDNGGPIFGAPSGVDSFDGGYPLGGSRPDYDM